MKAKVLMKNNPQLLEAAFNDWITDDVVVREIKPHDWRGQIVWAIFYEGQAIEEEVPSIPVPTKAPPPVQDMLCPHCNQLVRPAVFAGGPQKGKFKCPQCRKTFTEEMVSNG